MGITAERRRFLVEHIRNVGPVRQTSLSPVPSQSPGSIRLVAISDTHCRHRRMQIPAGDILIHAGDATMAGELDSLEDLDAWFGDLPHPVKIFVPGNHDIVFHRTFYDSQWWRFGSTPPRPVPFLFKNAIVLIDDVIEVCGIRVLGSPWVPKYHDWAFNLEQHELDTHWQMLPVQGVDVLITHGPPQGRRAVWKDADDIGDPALLAYTRRLRPAAHIFGHVHAGYGKVVDNGVAYVNAAAVNSAYNASNRPIVIDLIQDSAT